jgi:hypothetical protein
MSELFFSDDVEKKLLRLTKAQLIEVLWEYGYHYRAAEFQGVGYPEDAAALNSIEAIAGSK